MIYQAYGSYVSPLDAVGRWSFVGQYMVSARCEDNCHAAQMMVARDHLEEQLPRVAADIERAFRKIHQQ